MRGMTVRGRGGNSRGLALRQASSPPLGKKRILTSFCRLPKVPQLSEWMGTPLALPITSQMLPRPGPR
eukprot:14622638-Alexandrium_andersonii.AAC.1